jgi:DNA-binding MarR family transcriptional regulator
MQTKINLKNEQNINHHEACSQLLMVIERFREIDAEMQAQSIAVLLKVAKHPVPIKMSEIATELGLSQSTVSRNVAYLGDWNRRKEEGHKLLEAYEDPMERRRKLVRLTAKGKRVLKSINQIIFQE